MENIILDGKQTSKDIIEALKEKFEKYGTEKPWWIEEELKMIKAKGFEDKYEEMLKASLENLN